MISSNNHKKVNFLFMLILCLFLSSENINNTGKVQMSCRHYVNGLLMISYQFILGMLKQNVFSFAELKVC